MRLLRLRVVDFKGIHEAELELPQHVVRISGGNGAGKSSFIDGATVMLLGKTVICGDPIRKGADHAELEGDLGELGAPELKVKVSLHRIERDGQPDGYTYNLHVYDANGGKFKAPRDVLNQLVGQLNYDVSGFLDATPQQQLETLQELVPLTDADGSPFDLAQWERRDAGLRDQRTEVGRDIKALKGQLAGMTQHKEPTQPVDVAELVARITQIRDQQQQRERLMADVLTARQTIAEEEQERERLIEEINALRRRVEGIDENRARLKQAIEDTEREVDSLPADDPAPYEQQLASAQEVNDRASREAQENERYEKAEAELAVHTDRHEALATAIQDNVQRRQDAISRAEYPAGISLGKDAKGKPCVLWGDIPLEQASQSEQLRAAAAIGMYGNPKVRILMIRDASLFDKASLAELERLSIEHDFQVVEEIVDESGSVGVMFEGGRIADAPELKPEMALFTGSDGEGQ